MNNPIRILITGASGKSGLATVLSLLEKPNIKVRAMVRTEDHRAAKLRKAGAEVVFGDMRNLRDMRKAMKGVQRAHFISPVAEGYLDHALNFAVAAKKENVEHVVAIGQWLSSENHPSLNTRRTWLVDHLISWIPEVNFTIINVGFFADNLMFGLGTAAQLGVLALPIGSGSTALISNEDIGRVAAGVLSNPEPYAGRTLRPTGPKVLTPEEMATVFGEVLGREVTYKKASERMALKSMRVTGNRAPFEQAQAVHYLREYSNGGFAAGETTNVVHEVTGRPAEDLKTIVSRYASVNPLSKRSLSNKLRAIWQIVKVLLTRPIDLKSWERKNHIPMVDGKYCLDSEDWKQSHDMPGAYGVK